MADPAPALAEEARVRELLDARSDTRTLARAVLTPLEGGQSNRTWRLDQGERSFFVRLNAPAARDLGVDRASECRLLAVVAAAGIAPEVICCDPGAGFLLTRFIHAQPWSRADAARPVGLRRLGALLRQLHELPVDPAIGQVSFARQAGSLEARLPPGSVPRWLRAGAARRFERLSERDVECLCHNDPHHLNVLDDGARLWLIDWEYGGRGDPIYDLAACLSLLPDPEGACRELLVGYGSPAPCTDAEFDDARWVFDYVQWLWYRAQVAAGADTAGEFAVRAGRLETVLKERPERS